ncbi:CAAX protease self-immunity [Hyunsoonleella jejuensis]|uniref:CAAX protease self-immunity n=1 Tax=Hyunsoonleella jejuensis TaxID=419940 RepID=A0A1H9CWI6_9FLAO|nr:CPBP family intramembrane glutamic endopeptidase [Hyunsoonleella jejuensis]SEQ05509.1 CAAX protease self-immunity [Hyunsoonleella jejuensis]
MISVESKWTIIAIVFFTYFLVSWVYKRLEVVNLEKALLIRNGLRLLNLKHSLGIVLFGVLFYIIFPELRDLITNIEVPRLELLLSFVVLTILSAMISRISVKRIIQTEGGNSHYKFSNAWLYFIIRFVFLFCYEFFFRGVLLFSLLEYFNPTYAITLSVIAYLVIHLFDSKKEIIGAIPFGIVLCILAYQTQSIWYVFTMHLALSAVYEISIFYHQTLKT